MTLSLPDQVRTAWITGGGRGIGRAIAFALAEAGLQVAVSSRTVSDVEAVAAELVAAGHRALAVPADVSDRTSLQLAHDIIQGELGPVDVVVCNAGVAISASFLKTTPEIWEQSLGVNLTGVFHTIQLTLPSMLARGWGRVITVASIAGKVGHAYTSAYCASKHGVIGLTRALAQEVATRGVTVNAVCPGFVDTPMADAAVDNIVKRTGKSEEEARGYLMGLSPQRRFLTSEEVAAMVLFLVTDEARGIHGQAINLDGGGTPW